MSSFKEKIRLIGSSGFFFVFFVVFTFFGSYATYELFSFDDVIVYSWGYPLLILLPFIFFIFSFEIMYFAVKSRRVSKKTMSILWSIIRSIIITSILCSLLFSFLYKNELLSRGYVICKSIPSGWMPGMATEYAVSEELCRKKNI